MRMIVNSTNLVVDLVHTVGEIGELTKLAVQLGYDVRVEPATEEDVPGSQVRFIWPQRDFSVWGETHLVNMAMLYAYVNGRSGDQVLDTIRAQFVERCYPLDRPMQDVMEIASGNHEGHGHG
jgi:hypothetical protein